MNKKWPIECWHLEFKLEPLPEGNFFVLDVLRWCRYVTVGGLENSPPASASQVLELQVCDTMLDFENNNFIKVKYFLLYVNGKAKLYFLYRYFVLFMVTTGGKTSYT
jgi:hypothetical protein